jgi:alpha-mannosidase
MIRYLTTIAALLVSAQAIAIPVEIEVPAPAIKVTASSIFGSEQDVLHLIDGSGLIGESHDNESGARTMWHTDLNPQPADVAGIRSPAWVRFDFTTPQAFSRMLVWNHNQAGLTDRGFRKTRILGTTDGVAWKTLAELELPHANGSAAAATTVPISTKDALKAVVIAAESNWGGNVYGLSEVKFVSTKDVAAANLPFPDGIECAAQPCYRHRADGKAGREVQITFNGGKIHSAAEMEVLADGQTETVKLPATPSGLSGTTLRLPPGVGVDKDAQVQVTIKSGERSARQSFIVPKLRQWTVYVYPHSHVDIGYTNTQANVEIIHKRNLFHAIELAKRTADYPEGSRFLWNTEVSWPVERLFASCTPDEREAILDAIRKGWIHVEAGYVHTNTSVAAGEELDRHFDASRKIAGQTGVPAETMVQVDIPGISWGIVPAANRNGVKYLLLWNNGSDRTGRSMDISFRPFWWEGQDGKSRMLFLQPGSYVPGAQIKGKHFWPKMAGHTDMDTILQVVKTDNPRADFVDSYLWPTLDRLGKDPDYPYDLFAMSWCMADNTPVDLDLPDAVKSWNEDYAYPRLVIASATQIMKAFDERYGKTLPVRRGDFTEYWTDGLGSAARKTAMNRESKETLIQVGNLWAMLHPGKPAPDALIAEAWRNIILGSEHTWCYMNPAQQPMQDTIMAVKFDCFKQGRNLSRQALTETLEPLLAPQAPAVTVFNTLSWPRSGLAILPAGVEGLLDKDDAPVPTQKLTDGKVVFLAKDIPSLGSKSFRPCAPVAASASPFTVTPASLDNGLVKVALDSATGDIVSLVHGGTEFVDRQATTGVNSFRHLPGTGVAAPAGPQYAAAPQTTPHLSALRPAIASGPTDVRISIKENGPVLASLLVESKGAGIRWLKREIRLLAGRPEVEIINTLDKTSITEKEGIHFGFAFDVPKPRLRADIPWGVMEIEKDQFPEGNRNWICFQRWLDIGNESRGITWTSPDTPTFQVGGMTANVLGAATNSPEWIKTLDPSATIYSWALNNHWHTNFPLYQEGEMRFRYGILPRNSVFDSAASNRFGMEQSQPLIAAATQAGLTVKPPLTLDNPHVVVSSIKIAADGGSIEVTLRSLSDQQESVLIKSAAGTQDTLTLPPYGVHVHRIAR